MLFFVVFVMINLIPWQATQLFKFSEDVLLPNERFVYGGRVRNDRLAMKSATHELKSVQALIDAGMSELFFPLMAGTLQSVGSVKGLLH